MLPPERDPRLRRLDIQRRDTELIQNNQALCVVEHRLIGSNSYFGDILSVDVLIRRYEKGEYDLGPKLFKPLYLLQDQEDTGVVALARERIAESRRLQGMLPFLAPETGRAAIEKGYNIYVHPAPFDPETGLVVPVWKVGVLDNHDKIITDPVVLDTLVLHPQLQYGRLKNGNGCKLLIIGE